MIENFYHGLIKASKESALEGFAGLGNLTSWQAVRRILPLDQTNVAQTQINDELLSLAIVDSQPMQPVRLPRRCQTFISGVLPCADPALFL